MTVETNEKAGRVGERCEVAGASGADAMTRPASVVNGAGGQVRDPTRETQQAEFARAFSHVVAVLMRDKNFRNMRLGELEWLVLPPLLTHQWRLGKASARDPGKDKDAKAGFSLVPVAMALWARVSPEVDERLSETLDKPLVLKPNEWTSGDIHWLVAIAGDPRALPRFLKALLEGEFKGRDVKLRVAGGDGKSVVKTLADFLESVKPASPAPR